MSDETIPELAAKNLARALLAESECARLESELREERERSSVLAQNLRNIITVHTEKHIEDKRKLAASEAARRGERGRALGIVRHYRDAMRCDFDRTSLNLAICQIAKEPPPPAACSTCMGTGELLSTLDETPCPDCAPPAASGPATTKGDTNG